MQWDTPLWFLQSCKCVFFDFLLTKKNRTCLPSSKSDCQSIYTGWLFLRQVSFIALSGEAGDWTWHFPRTDVLPLWHNLSVFFLSQWAYSTSEKPSSSSREHPSAFILKKHKQANTAAGGRTENNPGNMIHYKYYIKHGPHRRNAGLRAHKWMGLFQRRKAIVPHRMVPDPLCNFWLQLIKQMLPLEYVIFRTPGKQFHTTRYPGCLSFPAFLKKRPLYPLLI